MEHINHFMKIKIFIGIYVCAPFNCVCIIKETYLTVATFQAFNDGAFMRNWSINLVGKAAESQSAVRYEKDMAVKKLNVLTVS